jgi:hypothetical protein
MAYDFAVVSRPDKYVPRCWNLYHSLEEAEAAAAHAPNYPVVMTFHAYEALKENFYLAPERNPLIPITAEQFDEALNCLMPLHWRTDAQGLETFCMRELLDGTITAQYAKYNGNHFCRNVDLFDRKTWIKLEELPNPFDTRRVLHVPSGATALCQPGFYEGTVRLQFDSFDHPHSHGWHVYPSSEVRDL